MKPEGDAFLLTIDLERRDVSDGFTTVIPVQVQMEGGKTGMIFIPNKQAKESITRKLPAKPKNIVFAPEYSLLASVRKD